MKVYLVWYISLADDASHLWGVYETKEKAQKEIEYITEDEYSNGAWWEEEDVL